MEQGLPPGYNVRDDKVADKSKSQRDEARKKTAARNLAEITKTMAGDIVARSVPLDYDSDGIAIIDREESPQVAPPSPQPTQPQAAAPAPAPAPAPRSQKQEELALAHPVLSKMLRVFGLSKTKSYKLDLFSSHDGQKVSYELTQLPEETTAWALAESKTKGLGNEGTFAYFQNLFVSASVIAIDNEPVWTVFGVAIAPEEQALLDRDPKNIPIRVRKACGKVLAELFWSDLGPVADKLWNFYEDVIAKENKVTSSYENEQAQLERYVCPIDGCNNIDFLRPQQDNKPYFCKIHGVHLVKGIEWGGGDLPLA